MHAFSMYLWVIYGISAIGLVFIAWWLFNKIKASWLADAIILMVTVLLLTPWFVVPDKFDLAPAIIILLSESLLLENGSILRAGIPLVGIYGLLIFILMIKRKLFRGRAKLAPSTEPDV